MVPLVFRVYGVNVCVLGCARQAVEVYDVTYRCYNYGVAVVAGVGGVGGSGGGGWCVITAGTDCTTTVHQKKP